MKWLNGFTTVVLYASTAIIVYGTYLMIYDQPKYWAIISLLRH